MIYHFLAALGAVRAAVKKYPDLHIVHFDAHAGLRAPAPAAAALTADKPRGFL